jgi:calcineurin-like phosphoesterase family protein
VTAARPFDVDAARVWFTSDLHLGHANIIRYCHRPFDDVDHMDAEIIGRWNARVSQGDTVFVVGDFSLSDDRARIQAWRDRLLGRVVLVRGNHDRRRGFSVFDDVVDLARVRVHGSALVDTQLLILCHYGLDVWEESHKGSWHLHGHSHGTLPPGPRRRLDVGVDTHDFAPWSFTEVSAVLASKPFVPVDAHGDPQGREKRFAYRARRAGNS